jgi:hypothetical protein
MKQRKKERQKSGSDQRATSRGKRRRGKGDRVGVGGFVGVC